MSPDFALGVIVGWAVTSVAVFAWLLVNRRLWR